MTTMEIAFKTARPLRATEKIRDVKPETSIINKIKSVLIGFEKTAFEKALLAKRDLDSILTRIYNHFQFQELVAVLYFWNSLPQVKFAR
jgi:hypothetical protein